MALIYPDFQTISKLRVPPTEGEFSLLEYLSANLDSTYEVFFNPFLDGDRPDIIILKKGHGAIIVEVKDWSLSSYSISKNNEWFVRTANERPSRIRSPHQQAFRYKTNMFELHLPILGMAEALNRNFYKSIHVFVYFHNSNICDIDLIYSSSLNELTTKKYQLNELKKYEKINYVDYDKAMNQLDRKIFKIKRDRAISFSEDTRSMLVKKIKGVGKNNLFSEEIYKEFKRRLSPPEWMYSQGKALELDEKQQKLTISSDGFAKIKGVVGCGKTSILSTRAVNAYKRHGCVLILTYNITLKHLIRDKISHISYHSQANVDLNQIEISNYHSFFMAQLNNLNKHIDVPNTTDEKELEAVFNNVFKDPSYFEGEDTIKYRSIFIDEVQDYEKEWISIIRNHFLAPDGEMVLFGDHAQNIYLRDESSLNKTIGKGFGSWQKLNKSYRANIDSLLISGFKQFQETFLQNRHEDLDILESKMHQLFLNTDIVVYQDYECSQINSLAVKIDQYIKQKNLIPNDIVIISSTIEILRTIESFFYSHEKTMAMFATDDDIKQLAENNIRCRRVLEVYGYDIVKLKKVKNKNDDETYTVESLAKIEKRKKNYFMQNSGLIKFSTLHSFKGMESKTVFYILHNSDNPEFIYTAITRAKTNLVIFGNEGSYYANFFHNVYNQN